MALITKIKEYREQAGMKQTELAEMVGARRETIVHLENGKYNPSLKLAMDIAKVFNKPDVPETASKQICFPLVGQGLAYKELSDL